LYRNEFMSIRMFGVFTIAGVGNFLNFWEIVKIFKSHPKWAVEFSETRLMSH